MVIRRRYVNTEIVYCGLQDATGRDVPTSGRRGRRQYCSDSRPTYVVTTPRRNQYFVDEISIQEMQNNPRLYDIASADYNIIIKDNIWKKISAEIEKFGKQNNIVQYTTVKITSKYNNSEINYIIFVNDTKKSWKNIRDTYTRDVSHLGDHTGLSISTWARFVVNYFCGRRTNIVD